MFKQEYYRQEYKKIRAGWEDSQAIYIKTVDRLLTNRSYVLDVGCGHTSFLSAVLSKTPHSYGVDPDSAAVAKNKTLRHVAVAMAEALPYPDNFFDVVALLWVLEHLDNPSAVFREIGRVLKPGGRVVFLTPNARNYNTWLIRAVPYRFHQAITKRLYGRGPGDAYPVRYRVNSSSAFKRQIEPQGFIREELIFNGDPTYISFNRPLFWIARNIEKLYDWSWLQSSRVHLIGMYKKA